RYKRMKPRTHSILSSHPNRGQIFGSVLITLRVMIPPLAERDACTCPAYLPSSSFGRNTDCRSGFSPTSAFVRPKPDLHFPFVPAISHSPAPPEFPPAAPRS